MLKISFAAFVKNGLLRIFKQRNLWEILCFDSMGLVCEKIEEYLAALNIEGMDAAKK